MVFRQVYNATLSEIHGLVLNNTGGVIYASPFSTKPSVVFETNDTDIVGHLAVTELASDELSLLSLALDPPKVQCSYTLKIYVPPNSLRALETAAQGDAILHDNTLNQDGLSDLSIVSRGSGNILVDVDSIEADDVVVAAHSSGSIQLLARQAIAANSIDLVSHRTGSVALLPWTLTTNSIATTSMRSGNVVVGGLSSNRPVISTEKLVAKALGKTFASGAAYTHLVVCQNSAVLLQTTGDIYVNVARSLVTQNNGSGSIYASLGHAATATGSFMPMPSTVVMPQYNKLQVADEVKFRPEPDDPALMTFAWIVYGVVLIGVVAGIVGACKECFDAWHLKRMMAKRGAIKTEFTSVDGVRDES
ncbi:hypothetical protein AC1031_012876 [Aphanomyces cochlioides]|nr:hypothetical protein AC1031_012876 [Aphanomyces cochlioides]